jgi:hypothetical protein
MGVVLAGLVLSSDRFESIAGMIGLSRPAFVDGPAGAALGLVPLAVLVWLLVRVPIGHAAHGGKGSA